jgi:hypothetical protein
LRPRPSHERPSADQARDSHGAEAEGKGEGGMNTHQTV